MKQTNDYLKNLYLEHMENYLNASLEERATPEEIILIVIKVFREKGIIEDGTQKS